MAYYYKGVIVAIIVSFCSIPCMMNALSDPGLSKHNSMYVYNYAIAITACIFFFAALPPNLCCENQVRRNEIYYGCLLLMCCCTANATWQNWRLRNSGENEKNENPGLSLDEVYLASPFGMTASFWTNIVNYFFYVAIIFMIDNCISYRNLILYWASATLTSELISILACYTGSHAHLLRCYELMHCGLVFASSWVMFKFLVYTPRCIVSNTCSSNFPQLDKTIILSLFFLIIFCMIRGLAVLNISQLYIREYTQIEPYIAHPSRFGAVWALYTAIYGIPLHVLAMKGLLNQGSPWMIDLSIIYAASLFQGTLVFLSYQFFPSADPKYLPPRWSTKIGSLLVNIWLVSTAYLLMYRCLKNQGYFRRACAKKVPCPPEKVSCPPTEGPKSTSGPTASELKPSQGYATRDEPTPSESRQDVSDVFTLAASESN